jgi:hypothetical protein
LLVKNPCKRLGFIGGVKDIMKHAFFRDVDWTKLRKKQYQSDQPKAYLTEMALQIIEKQPYALKDHPRTQGELCPVDHENYYEQWDVDVDAEIK